MSRFCENCGREVEENEVCACEKSVNNESKDITSNEEVNEKIAEEGNESLIEDVVNEEPNDERKDEAIKDPGQEVKGEVVVEEIGEESLKDLNKEEMKEKFKKIRAEFREDINESLGAGQDCKFYLNNMNEGTKNIINKGKTSFVVISGIIFMFSIFLNFFVLFNNIKNEINEAIDMMGLWYLDLSTYKLSINLGKIVLNSLLLGILLILVLFIITFILAKFKKSSFSSKGILYSSIINTIPMTVFFTAGGVVQAFIPYEYILYIPILYLIIYIVMVFINCNIVIDGFTSVKDISIFVFLMLLGIIAIIFVYCNLLYSTFVSYQINGQGLKEFIEIISEELMKAINSGSLEEIIQNILNMSTMYNLY